MELLNAFLEQGGIAPNGEIIDFVNEISMAMQSQWKENMVLD